MIDVRLDPDQLRELAALVAEALAERSDRQALLPADQAGEVLNLPPSWLLAQARRGAIPHHRFGHHVRFIPAEILAWDAERNGRGQSRTNRTKSRSESDTK